MDAQDAYAFFRDMELEQLESLALDAIVSLAAAASRADAERAALTAAPFFLRCTYWRLSRALQKRLSDLIDKAEDRFGSLAGVLGLDDEAAEQPLASDKMQWN